MKLAKLTALSVAVLALLSSSTCSKQADAPAGAPATEKTSTTMEKKEFTPEFLNLLGRVGGPQVSPDGKKILYGVTYYDTITSVTVDGFSATWSMGDENPAAEYKK